MKKVLIPTKLESVARQILEKHGGYQVIQDDKTDINELARQHLAVDGPVLELTTARRLRLKRLPRHQRFLGALPDWNDAPAKVVILQNFVKHFAHPCKK